MARVKNGAAHHERVVRRFTPLSIWRARLHVTHAYVYILLCSDGSYYTGLTRRDPEARVSEHQQGLDVYCYTYSRRPVALVFAEYLERVDEAVAMERRVKGWSRAKKQALIERNYHGLSRLASRAAKERMR